MTQSIAKNSDSQNYQDVSSNISIEREGSTLSSKISSDSVAFQAELLEGVSRTFALTIPRLPAALREVVANAYLLCRTVDTIEDEPGLSRGQKKEFCDLFQEVLAKKKDATLLTNQLGPLLTSSSIPAEHQLIRELGRVVSITNSFDPEQQQALYRCVRIMSEGMVYFQHHASSRGLADQREMDKYCYHVAGIVGEMLTELFSHYAPEIARHRSELFELSTSFGQGLQMTNILKDIWDDHRRDACWLPRDLFEKHGLDLQQIQILADNEKFQLALRHLVGLAHGHLENAMKYTLLIPTREKGIREFCLWAIGMAMLTLRKINRNPGFTDGQQVKISRKSVKATVVITGISVKNNGLLKILFRWLGKGLPKEQIMQ